MKWKGRRQSKNLEDKTDEIVVIPEGEKMFGGYRWDKRMDNLPAKMKREELERKKTNSKDEHKVKTELHRHDRDGTTPTPSPKPKRIQVTPGEWKTNK